MSSLKRINLIISNIKNAIASLTWKRDSSVVLFGAWFGQKFADNSRYLFQYLSDNKDRFSLSHVVWVTRNHELNIQLNEMGYESYMIDSPESINYHKTAKYHVICNTPYSYRNINSEILGKYSFGAKRINLWHGVAGKGVGYASSDFIKNKTVHPLNSKIMLLFHKMSLWRKFVEHPGGWGDCYYLTISPSNRTYMKDCFLLPESRYIYSGYPRVYDCPKLTNEERKVVDIIAQYSAVFLYLPTFRTSNQKYNFETLAEEIKDTLDVNDSLWIQKSHSADSVNTTAYSYKGNVLKLNPDFDINTIMPYISILVTDYSSCAIDALYHNKGILFYVPDYDIYMREDRGIYTPLDSFMCGPQLNCVDDLKSAISKFATQPGDARNSQYETIQKEYWSLSYKKNLERVWEDIVNQTR